jgi:hypothetical protein
MKLLAEKHPEMRPLVAGYKRMTLPERFRKRAPSWARQSKISGGKSGKPA